MGCNMQVMHIVEEKIQGFVSKFKLKCSMCNGIFDISTSEDELQLNKDAVLGIMAAGLGYAALSQISASLELPCISQKSYLKTEDRLSGSWEKISVQSMEEAARQEREMATAVGDVDPNGVPMITVVADGSWAKRSYRSNYNSLSGAAAIIGYKTKKVLFLGVKNKFCTICKLAENKCQIVSKHKCYKNFKGSSSSMEGDILKEGFCSSIAMHGLIYNKLIADGDSNCYKKILDSHPYQTVVVKKIECRNHLLRNFSRKIRDLVKDKNAGPLVLRKQIEVRKRNISMSQRDR